jgi:tetratricopeptide (TPR) repeat protein
MRAFVFTDRSLTRLAGRFVWLEIDTEKKQNAAVKKRLGVPALPTYFVVDPVSEQVTLRWVGGFTVAQLERLLDDGVAAVRGGAGRSGADDALARADRLYGEGRDSLAVLAYREALALAPPGWPQYARVIEALLFALDRTGAYAAAAGLASEAYPRVRGTASGANVAGSGLAAALLLPDSAPQRGALVAAFEAEVREVLADNTLGIADDDRSGLYLGLLGARRDAKDEEGAKRVAMAWSAFLEGAAARAKTPEQRTVFDSHRLSAYRELGQIERAIPMLEAAERDLPGDYNPPARLATAYLWMSRWDEALAPSDRALAKAYGPRKLGIYSTRSDIFSGKGDRDAARRTLEAAIAYADALPPGQRSENAIAGLRRKLEALE